MYSTGLKRRQRDSKQLSFLVYVVEVGTNLPMSLLFYNHALQIITQHVFV